MNNKLAWSDIFDLKMKLLLVVALLALAFAGYQGVRTQRQRAAAKKVTKSTVSAEEQTAYLLATAKNVGSEPIRFVAHTTTTAASKPAVEKWPKMKAAGFRTDAFASVKTQVK